MNSNTVTQQQAAHMRHALTDACRQGKRKNVAGAVMVTVSMGEGTLSLIDHLLARIESGELHATPAPIAPAYSQPAMLGDDAGSPLFSMGG